MVLSIHQNYMMRVVAIAALYLLQLQAITPVLLAVAATNLPSPGCISKCGEISIPFPFGVSAGCYRKGFKLTCNETYNPPKLFMDNTRAEVLDISLHHGKLYVDNGIISLTGGDGYSMTWGIPLDDSIFTVSPFWNNFVIMGCGFEFRVSLPDSQNMVVRCTSTCLGGRPAVAIDGVCSGVGCCQASMPGAGNMYSIKLASYPYTAVEDVTIPGRPFNATLVMVENEWWNTDSHSMLVQKGVSDGLITPTGPVQTKAVVKWNFSNLSCADAQSSSVSGCLSYNSYCHDHWTGKSSGHICCCSDGYEGNPYTPNGCQGMQLIICKEKRSSFTSSSNKRRKKRVPVPACQLYSQEHTSYLSFALQQILTSAHSQINTNASVIALTWMVLTIASVHMAPPATPRSHMDASKLQKSFQVTRSPINL